MNEWPPAKGQLPSPPLPLTNLNIMRIFMAHFSVCPPTHHPNLQFLPFSRSKAHANHRPATALSQPQDEPTATTGRRRCQIHNNRLGPFTSKWCSRFQFQQFCRTTKQYPCPFTPSSSATYSKANQMWIVGCAFLLHIGGCTIGKVSEFGEYSQLGISNPIQNKLS